MNIKIQETIKLYKQPIVKKPYKRMRQIKSHNRKDYTGKKFGMLKALNFKELTGKSRSLRSLWDFKCDCGKKTTKIIYDVINGKTKSCGCLNLQTGKNAKNWRGYKDIPHTYFSTLKSGATTRKLDFKITIKYIWGLFIKQNKKCSLSNVKLEFNTNCFKNTASLDRINSSKGYIKGNVQWVHKIINFMKQNLSDDIFIEWCKKVADYRKI